MARDLEDDWTGEDVTIAEIERELARLRDATRPRARRSRTCARR